MAAGRRRGGPRGRAGARRAIRQRLDGHRPDGLAALHGGDTAAACREGTPYRVRIVRRGSGETLVHTGSAIPFANSFGSVPVGQPLLYLNSLGKVSLAINEGSFAARHGVGSGPEWGVIVEPGNGR